MRRKIGCSFAIAMLLSSQVALAQKTYTGIERFSPSGGNQHTLAGTPTSACTATGYSFGFFNGVLTTPTQANIAKEYLERAYGTTAPNGETIKYEVYYNYTAGFEDFVETFDQRLNEQETVLHNRFELFFEALNGGGSYFDRILGVITNFSQFNDLFTNYVRTRIVDLLAHLAVNPPTLSNYTEHRTRLDARIVEGKKLLFFAHSQGNLFANAAYDYAVGKSSADSVKVVHVAPASVLLHGDHTLADLDLVIQALGAVGQVPPVTTSIPGPLSRPPGVNGQKDIKGHGLLEIYLNTSLATAGRINGQVTAALNALRSPPQTGQDGFFTATLTWNGSGDVDLHTFEPGGSHVYYSAPQGSAGFLDTDNTVANGPEHYYASCDVNKLQVGTYRIGVNNYALADGRTAVVQISTSRDGVLTTRSIVLGAARGSGGNSTPTNLVNVTVSKDSTTGQYSATIG